MVRSQHFGGIRTVLVLVMWLWVFGGGIYENYDICLWFSLTIVNKDF